MLCSQYESSSQCGRAYFQSEKRVLLSFEKDVDRLPRDSRSRRMGLEGISISESDMASRYRNNGTECSGIRPKQTKSMPTPSFISSSVVRSRIDFSTWKTPVPGVIMITDKPVRNKSGSM